MTRLMDCPPRHVVLAAIRAEAAAANMDEQLVLNTEYRSPAVVEARHKAIRRILAETNCSKSGLAKVWGLSFPIITAATGAKGTRPERGSYRPREVKIPPPVNGYDPNTIERLRWAHGDAKAAQIADGRDPWTQADIARWRAIGGEALTA